MAPIRIEANPTPITGKKYKVTIVGWRPINGDTAYLLEGGGWTTIVEAAAYALEGSGVSFYRIWPNVSYNPVTFFGMEKFLSYLDCKSVEMIDD